MCDRIFIFFLILLPYCISAQEISGVTFVQTGDKVEVYYDLIGSETDVYQISLYYSTDGGRSFAGPLRRLEGDFSYVTPGKDKKVIWKTLQEVSSFSSDQVVMKVKVNVANETFNHPKNFHNKNSMPEMIYVSGGSFLMGISRTGINESEDETAYNVAVSDYYIGKYEVSIKEFASFIEETNYQTDAEVGGGAYVLLNGKWEKKVGINWRHDSQGNLRPQTEYHHPVIFVSWNDAFNYCEWLNQKTEKVFRLPTEVEWEYASKGGRKSRGYAYAGSNNLNQVAWFQENSDFETHVKGKKLSNELRIYDMSGNVHEWCQDLYGNYPTKQYINPKEPTKGINRIFRGGSFHNNHNDCQVIARYSFPPNSCYSAIGFRVLREL